MAPVAALLLLTTAASAAPDSRPHNPSSLTDAGGRGDLSGRGGLRGGPRSLMEVTPSAPTIEPRTYVDGPHMVSDSLAASSCAGAAYETLPEAEEACDRTSGCEVLHDFACDGEFWRLCSSVTSEFWAVAPADSGACTKVVEGYAPPPRPSAPAAVTSSTATATEL